MAKGKKPKRSKRLNAIRKKDRAKPVKAKKRYAREGPQTRQQPDLFKPEKYPPQIEQALAKHQMDTKGVLISKPVDGVVYVKFTNPADQAKFDDKRFELLGPNMSQQEATKAALVQMMGNNKEAIERLNAPNAEVRIVKESLMGVAGNLIADAAFGISTSTELENKPAEKKESAADLKRKEEGVTQARLAVELQNGIDAARMMVSKGLMDQAELDKARREALRQLEKTPYHDLFA